MARIAGTNVPNDKRIEYALTYVYGVGLTRAREILKATKINPDIRAKDLLEDQLKLLRDYIEKNFRVEGELRRDIGSNIRRLKEIGSYRGSRHSRGLPARGQRTKTNTRTVRGNKRVTMGSGKRTLTKT